MLRDCSYSKGIILQEARDIIFNNLLFLAKKHVLKLNSLLLRSGMQPNYITRNFAGGILPVTHACSIDAYITSSICIEPALEIRIYFA